MILVNRYSNCRIIDNILNSQSFMAEHFGTLSPWDKPILLWIWWDVSVRKFEVPNWWFPTFFSWILRWKLFNDICAIPLGVAAVSLVLLSLHALYRGIYHCINCKTEEEDGGKDGLRETCPEGLSARLKAHVFIFSGYAIYGFMLACLFGSMVLFYLSIVTLHQCTKAEVGECPEAYFTIPYVSVLASRTFLGV